MKTLIFDFDGTIADSFEIFLAVFEQVNKRSQPLSEFEVSQLRGKSFKQSIKYLKIKSWQIPRLLLKAKPNIKQRFDGVKPFIGLPAIINQLHTDGHEIFIVSTNNAQTINEFLKRYKMESYFSHVYGDIGLRGKAGALKKVIKKHRLNKANCTYIGDEVRDVEAAKKVGLQSVAVGWGFNFPEALIKANPTAFARQPAELLKILIN